MAKTAAKLIKFLMLAINIFLLIFSIALIGFGIWIYLDKSFFQFLIGENKIIVTGSILFIIIGILSFLISSIGFCGTHNEIKCLLTVYFVFIFIIFCLVVVSIIMIFIFRSEIDERMSTELFNSISKYGEETAVTEAWNIVQQNFECCGVTANTITLSDPPYKSWENNKYFLGNIKVPISCCKDSKNRTCNNISDNLSDFIYHDDCFEKLKSYFKEHAFTLCASSILIAILLLIAMTLSCSLFCMIKS